MIITHAFWSCKPLVGYLKSKNIHLLSFKFLFKTLSDVSWFVIWNTDTCKYYWNEIYVSWYMLTLLILVGSQEDLTKLSTSNAGEWVSGFGIK